MFCPNQHRPYPDGYQPRQGCSLFRQSGQDGKQQSQRRLFDKSPTTHKP